MFVFPLHLLHDPIFLLNQDQDSNSTISLCTTVMTGKIYSCGNKQIVLTMDPSSPFCPKTPFSPYSLENMTHVIQVTTIDHICYNKVPVGTKLC